MPEPVRELASRDMERLSAILGGPEYCSMSEESEFCAESGCPPEQLESWLKDYWNEHDISAVLAGTEKAGPSPVLVLVHQYADYFTMRLFSPSDKLSRDCGEITELRRIWRQK